MGILDSLNIMKSYPVRVQIAEMRGGAIRWDFDKARVVKEGNSKHFELQKRKDTIPIAKFKQLQVDRKGRSVLTLLSPALGRYEPMEVHVDEKLLTANPTSEDMAFWAMLETRRIDEIFRKKQGLWDKYGTLIGLAMIIAALMFTVIYVTQSLELIASSAASAAHPLAAAVDRLAALVEKMNLQPVPGG